MISFTNNKKTNACCSFISTLALFATLVIKLTAYEPNRETEEEARLHTFSN